MNVWCSLTQAASPAQLKALSHPLTHATFYTLRSALCLHSMATLLLQLIPPIRGRVVSVPSEGLPFVVARCAHVVCDEGKRILSAHVTSVDKIGPPSRRSTALARFPSAKAVERAACKSMRVGQECCSRLIPCPAACLPKSTRSNAYPPPCTVSQ